MHLDYEAKGRKRSNLIFDTVDADESFIVADSVTGAFVGVARLELGNLVPFAVIEIDLPDVV